MDLDPDVIHQALADQIKSYIPSLNVSPFPWAGQPFDRVEIWPDPDIYINYQTSYGGTGMADVFPRIRLDVDTPNAETAFKRISKYLKSGTNQSTSIRDAINADATLGGVVHKAMVLSVEWPEDFESKSQTVWIPVRVITQRA